MSEGCPLQRDADACSMRRRPIRAPGARLAILVATLAGAGVPCAAQDAANPRLQEVIIQAERAAADEEVTRAAEKTLADDPWIFSDHVTITTRHGVVRVEGIVGDTWEMFRIVRLCRRIPGAKRVVNELEIMHNDPDGG